MMDVSSFRVDFSMDSEGHLTMTVTAHYCSTEIGFGAYKRDHMVLLKTRYRSYDNNYSRIANLCTPKRFVSVQHFDVYDPHYWSCEPKPLYAMCYSFLYADGIKSMKAALDSYGISWDYNVLGLDDLPL